MTVDQIIQNSLAMGTYVPGKTAVFYSGMAITPEGLIPNWMLANQIVAKNPEQYYTIETTPGGIYLNSQITALAAAGTPLTADERNEAWNALSEQMAQTAKGPVLACVEGEVSPAGTFSTIEYPNILKNTAILDVNGLKTSTLPQNFTIGVTVLAPNAHCYDPYDPDNEPASALVPVPALPDNAPALADNTTPANGAVASPTVTEPASSGSSGVDWATGLAIVGSVIGVGVLVGSVVTLQPEGVAAGLALLSGLVALPSSAGASENSIEAQGDKDVSQALVIAPDLAYIDVEDSVATGTLPASDLTYFSADQSKLTALRTFLATAPSGTSVNLQPTSSSSDVLSGTNEADGSIEIVFTQPGTSSASSSITYVSSSTNPAAGSSVNIQMVPADFLILANPTSFAGTISNFSQGDTIDLASVGAASSVKLGAGNLLTVTKTDGTTVTIKLDPKTDYTGKAFNVAPDTNGGTNITLAGGTSNLAFVFDTTGSMDPYIAAVKADSTAILNAEFSNYATADVSVISFKDPQAGYPDQVIQPFTNNQKTLQNAINSLTASGGGDIPEGDYSGLLLALNGSAGKWDTDAGVIRQIILYTDAPVKDTDLAAQVNQYAHDLNTVVNTMTVSASAVPTLSAANPSGAPEHTDAFTFAATASGATPAPVQIDTIQVGNDTTATTSVQKIATDNSGTFLQAPTPDQLTQAILKDINNPGTVTVNNFTIADQTTGATTQDAGLAYSGPVAGLTNEYINVISDNLNITSHVPNAFIHSGSGNDAIDVSAANGQNVLDGGTGSNFLTGGSGTDTFFVDDRGPPADIWSTVSNFHAGDAATIYGVTATDFNLAWINGQGATGYTGLTLHATAPGKPTASLTLVGFTQADMTNGRLSISFGTDTASSSTYMYVHANS